MINRIFIENKADCYGCGACADICSKNAISMIPDKQGFLYPSIDEVKCINCGLCQKACQIGNEKNLTYDPVSVCKAVKANDDVRAVSSSGGIYTILSDKILENSGACVGVTYDDELRVKHEIAQDTEQRDKFRGSKYVQSDMGDILSRTAKILQENKKVLFSGTPCQVAALKTYLKTKKIDDSNLVTIDIVCHGVPSPKIWSDYISFVQKEYNSKIKSYTFRDKKSGWRGYNIRAEFEDGTIVQKSSVLMTFVRMFMKDVMLRPSCFYCPYCKMGRCGDITIGDFWGIEKCLPDFSDNTGISMVFLNTEKGKDLFAECEQSMVIEECKTEKLTQHNLYASSNFGEYYNEFWNDYNKGGFKKVARKYGDYGLISKFYYYRDAIKYKIRNKIG